MWLEFPDVIITPSFPMVDLNICVVELNCAPYSYTKVYCKPKSSCVWKRTKWYSINLNWRPAKPSNSGFEIVNQHETTHTHIHDQTAIIERSKRANTRKKLPHLFICVLSRRIAWWVSCVDGVIVYMHVCQSIPHMYMKARSELSWASNARSRPSYVYITRTRNGGMA